MNGGLVNNTHDTCRAVYGITVDWRKQPFAQKRCDEYRTVLGNDARLAGTTGYDRFRTIDL